MMSASPAFTELLNLDQAARTHLELCRFAQRESCTVSLMLLRHTADRLLPKVNVDEYAQAKALVEAWPV